MSVEAEYVLLDSSPILLIPDNLYMAAATDGVILVVAGRPHAARGTSCARRASSRSRARRSSASSSTRSPVRKVNQYYSYYRAYAKADTKA